MFDLSDPKTYWLNLTNIGLGLVTLACVVIAAKALFRDILDRLFVRAEARTDARLFVVPGLGTTLADGGEPLPKDAPTRKGAEDVRQ